MSIADSARERLRRDPLAGELELERAGHGGWRESLVG